MDSMDKICTYLQNNSTSSPNDYIENIVKNIKDKRYGNCPICLDEINPNKISVTECGHIFCYECIHRANSFMAKCPICQETLTCKKAKNLILLPG